MNLLLERKWRKDKYCIGRLYIDGKYFCNTLEDKDRGLYDFQSESYIKSKKVYGETAIPRGHYKVILSYSPKFSVKPFYKSVGNGHLPEIQEVKCFSRIRIHCGNSAKDSLGCILVGKNTVVGGLTQSQANYRELMEKYLIPAYNRGEEITLTITG